MKSITRGKRYDDEDAQTPSDYTLSSQELDDISTFFSIVNEIRVREKLDWNGKKEIQKEKK